PFRPRRKNCPCALALTRRTVRRTLRTGGSMIRIAALTACFALVSCGPSSPPPAQDFHPTVTRNKYGVPHVHGRTDAEVAYGVALAHAEDNFETIQITVLL